MNELELKEMNSERVVYSYKPDGKGTPGEIIYILGTGEIAVSARASGDEHGRYAHKAGKRISLYVCSREEPSDAGYSGLVLTNNTPE